MIKPTLPLAIAATVLAAAALPQALAAGGLSISPAIVEHLARPGVVGSIDVKNATGAPLAITVAARPWRQSRSGAVAPDRRRTLASRVRVSAGSFTLAPGARRSVALTLLRAPSAGSLYGALEVVGKPPKRKKRTGIIAAYRLVGAIRLNPAAAARRLGLRLGAARIAGNGAKRAIKVALRNAGNTVDPVTGTARISGSRGTRTLSIAAKRIVPGATIDLALGAIKGLPAGGYRARISLFQAGKPVLATTRRFRIR
jgi:hypothetical protein